MAHLTASPAPEPTSFAPRYNRSVNPETLWRMIRELRAQEVQLDHAIGVFEQLARLERRPGRPPRAPKRKRPRT